LHIINKKLKSILKHRLSVIKGDDNFVDILLISLIGSKGDYLINNMNRILYTS